MAVAERKAEVIWNGTLTRGTGQIEFVSSHAVQAGLPITWASRTERGQSQTSPEELIAAAHAGCYAMALSSVLGEAKTPPKQLKVSAVCVLDMVGGAPKITKITLDVSGTVPGLDAEGFAAAAHKAEQACPVSNALRNNVEIELNIH